MKVRKRALWGSISLYCAHRQWRWQERKKVRAEVSLLGDGCGGCCGGSSPKS